jgi:hypothetical protein
MKSIMLPTYILRKIPAWYTKFPPKNTVADTEKLGKLLDAVAAEAAAEAPLTCSSAAAPPVLWYGTL